jgi:phosphate:Na+ symporter
VYWFVPLSDAEKEAGHLRFLDTGLVSTPELADVEARRALQAMVGVCKDMFGQIQEVVKNPDKKLGKVVDAIKRGEVKTDQMEEEIVAFCSHLAREGTSARVSRDVASYLDMANDIERMGDHCFNLVLLSERRYEKKFRFDDETQKNLSEMMSLVSQFLAFAHKSLDSEPETRPGDGQVLESKIDKLRDSMRKQITQRMQQGEMGIREGLIFLDMMTNMEKLGDYCLNITQATMSLRNGAESN